MFSVDLAFDLFIQRNHLNVDVTRYCYREGISVANLAQHHTLNCKSFEQNYDEALSSDVILFWGDFQHAYNYWINDLANDTKRITGCNNPKSIIKHIAKHLCLSEASDSTLSKTLSFGSSLIGDDTSTLLPGLYQRAFERFAQKSSGIWHRDPISSFYTWQLRTHGGTCQAIDCALLSSQDDYLSLSSPASRPDNNYACIFFGRSNPLRHYKNMVAATNVFCERLNLQPSWIPWLNSPKTIMNSFFSSNKKATIDCQDNNYGQLIDSVLNAKLTITDTYHLAAISWRLGVPAICFGTGAQHPNTTLFDKKKEMFYTMYRATPLYFFIDQTNPAALQESLNQATNLIQQKNACQEISRLIDKHAQSSEQILINALRGFHPLSTNQKEK